MPIDVQPFLQWAAPIASTVIITACTALINRWMEQSKRDAKAREEREELNRQEDREWRKRVEQQLQTHGEFIAERDDWFDWRRRIEDHFGEVDKKIDTVLMAQCTQMRSDCLHRAHRYIDDLGCASVEEKDSFYAEWQEYQRICEAYGITNSFVNDIVQKVMALPTREIRVADDDD